MDLLCWGGIYKLTVTVTNYIYGVSLSDYRGVNEVSVRNIVIDMPRTIPAAYKAFYRFFFAESIQNNIFGNRTVNLCIFMIAGFLIVYKLSKYAGRNLSGTILVLFMIMMIPLACNISLLIASKTGVEEEISILMAGAMTIVPILFMNFLHSFKKARILYGVYIIALCISLWVNIWIVNNDQLAMREGRIGTVTITQNIISRLIDEGYLGGNEEYEMIFIGRTSDNELFQKTDAWRSANDYAAFGRWWTGVNPSGQSWRALVREYCGVSMRICGDEDVNNVLATGEVDGMPAFPNEGCIRIINDIVVVKVSDMN